MKHENYSVFDCAHIERGIITQTSGSGYDIQSFSRSGLYIKNIPAMGGAEYQTGDRIYFFIFNDGHGLIIGKMT